MEKFFRAVKPMRKSEIERAADQLRKILGLDNQSRTVMIKLVETVLEEVIPGYLFTVLPDEEMPGMDGLSGLEDYEICLSNSTYVALSNSDPDARHTTAHELGHLVLHTKNVTAMARRTHYEFRVDPEWQADYFADVWLMPRDGVLTCSNAKEVAKRFSVPAEAAERRFAEVFSENFDEIQGELFN